MSKQINSFIYVVVGLLLIAASVFAILSNKRGALNNKAAEMQTIEGARANSFQAVLGGPKIKSDDLIIGSDKADLKIFVYEDYSSPLSANLAMTLEQLSQENNGRLAIITRPFVISSNSLSLEAGKVMLCAQEAGKGQEMRAQLFSLAKDDNFSLVNISEAIEALKINKEDFNVCLTNEEKSLKLEAMVEEAKQNLVLGAPTMFVGEEMILGARPYGDFVDSNGDAIEGLKTVVDRKLSEM